MISLTAQLDKQAVKRFINAVKATPKQIDVAQRSALTKTLRWGNTQLARRLAKANAMPVSIFKGGVKNRHGKRIIASKIKLGQRSGTLWVGTNPVKATYLGKARELKRGGVKVGKYFYQDAFLRRVSSGHIGIFRRKGKPRLPIESVTQNIDLSETEILYVKNQLPKKLRDVMSQEINYQVNVRGKR